MLKVKIIENWRVVWYRWRVLYRMGRCMLTYVKAWNRSQYDTRILGWEPPPLSGKRSHSCMRLFVDARLEREIYIYIYIYIYRERESFWRCHPGDLGPTPGRILPKTLKMVLDTSLLNTQHYKVRIEGKVEQSRERSSALSHTLV